MSTLNRLIAKGMFLLVLIATFAGCYSDDEAPAEGTVTPAELSPGVGPVAIGPDGGQFELVAGKLTVSLPPGALTDGTSIEANEVRVPDGLPAGLTPVASAFEITVDNPDVLDAPLQFAMPYDSQAGGVPLVMHYSASDGYRPATVVGRDAGRSLIFFEARSFSSYVAVNQDVTPDTAFVTNGPVTFSPSQHGFSIPNQDFPTLFSSGGTCLGMAVVARWHFMRSQGLYNRFTQPVQSVLALLAQAGSVPNATSDALVNPASGPAAVVRDIKALVSLNEPVLLILRQATSAAKTFDHAVLVYGYNASQLFAYDPNFPGEARALPYTNAGVQPYEGFDLFVPLVIETVAPKFDIEKLIDQAGFGFAQSQDFQIDAPIADEVMNQRRGQLTGSVSNTGIERFNLFTNAGMQVIEAGAGTINAYFPVFGGPNTLVLLGGPTARSRISYARSGGLVRKISSPLPKAELFTMMTWKQPVDLDLYVHSPASPDDVAWYNSTTSASGMTLDIDSRQFGPELITLSTQDPAHPGARIETGAYRIRAHYFRGSGAVSGDLLIAVNENSGPVAAACRLGFTISSSNEGNDRPGDTGPDWRDLATVDLAAGTITPAAGLACRQR